MYAETGLLFPCFQNFSQGVQQYEDLCRAQRSNALISNLVSPGSSMISEYDLGGEGDLFKALEAIMIDYNEPMMMSSGEAMMSSREADDQLLSEVLYECEKDLLEQAAMEIPLYEPLEITAPATSLVDEASPFQKSVSSECLCSMDWAYHRHHQHGGPALTAPLPEADEEGLMDLSARMRRAFSEGDIKTLGSGDGDANGSSAVKSPCPSTMVIGKSISRERKEQLSRYRTKKSKRNFGRKIKYACRKALADSQPRIRGRFARTE